MDFSWFADNRESFEGQILLDEPLAKHTYYRIGGPARVVAIPKSRADLEWIHRGLAESRARLFILGAGSNILASDDGFDGIVIRVNRFCLDIEQTSDPSRIRTGGGVSISTLLRRASQEGWGGLEFLTGIPGSVGGAVRMNAGTHLGETKSALRKVEAYSLKSGEWSAYDFEKGELRLEYRKNLFLPEDSVVTSAEWQVARLEPEAVKQQIDETLARRKATQPIEYPSCGSVFKNPPGSSAWQIVDKLGLRGQRIGNAQISEKHSNFIINLGGATAADVRALIELARTRARDELEVELEAEVIELK